MYKIILFIAVSAVLMAGEKKKDDLINLKLENAVLRIGLAQEQYKSTSRLLSDIKIAYEKAVKELDEIKLVRCQSVGGKSIEDCEYSFNGDSADWKITKKEK
jgi:hypothetical protein